jgi:hypothetical protein
LSGAFPVPLERPCDILALELLVVPLDKALLSILSALR